MRTKASSRMVLSPNMLSNGFDSLSDRVAATLREAIFRALYRPGDRLVEEVVAQQLGTSRGPVRDAIKMLQQEGVVTVIPRRGAFVTVPTPDEARNMYGIRIVLEEYAARLAVEHITDVDLAELRSRVELMHQAAEMGDLCAHLEQDILFHDLIWERAGNPKLLQLRSLILPQIRAYSAASGALIDLHELADLHNPVVEALSSRDPERSGVEVREHVAAGAQRWIAALESSNLSVETRLSESVNVAHGRPASGSR